MISREELVSYLDNLLGCANFNDYAPNGLQVEGSEQISSICTAVTASNSVIEQAAEFKVDALLVHHGYFWRGESPVIAGIKRLRIGRLLSHDINLLAFHLPLDCHQELGNNALLGQIFGVHSVNTHRAGNTPDLLWSGSFSEAKSADELTHFLTDKLNRAPLHIGGNNRLIKKIAWCSGAAQDYILNANTLGVDAYISGEISERTYYEAEELGIHYFACGHHATERFGIEALGIHLANQFNLQHHFIDSDNPV